MNCGFLFNPQADPDTVSHGVAETTSIVHLRHRIIAGMVSDWAVEEGRTSGDPFRVVEVGAGTGIIGGLLKQNCKIRYIGYEPSEARAKVAERNGVDVRNSFFEQTQAPGNIDCVIFGNVLEHVMDPVGLVAVTSSALSPRGRMVIVVPGRNDLRRLSAKWSMRHYWQPHCHVNHFRRRDVARMLRHKGLKSDAFPLGPVLEATKSCTWRLRFLLDRLGITLFGIYMVGRKE
jgi:SAM-dependent methyltransferase